MPKVFRVCCTAFSAIGNRGSTFSSDRGPEADVPGWISSLWLMVFDSEDSLLYQSESIPTGFTTSPVLAMVSALIEQPIKNAKQKRRRRWAMHD